MSKVLRYFVTDDPDGDYSSGYEYDNHVAACDEAKRLSQAVVEVTYEYAESEIAADYRLPKLTTCERCGAMVNPAFGAEPPVAHSDAEGTADDPRSPGDRDNICDRCCYLDDPHGIGCDKYPAPDEPVDHGS